MVALSVRWVQHSGYADHFVLVASHEVDHPADQNSAAVAVVRSMDAWKQVAYRQSRSHLGFDPVVESVVAVRLAF